VVTVGTTMARTTKSKTTAKIKAQTIEEWLAAGNKITICPPGMRSEDLEPMGSPRGYGKKRKAKKRD
jgi:hypothetical protein